MARQPGDSWSTARVETLTAMADAGHTAADVAVRLGTSRSAVLGKANRLGIRFSGQAVPLAPLPASPGQPDPEQPTIALNVLPKAIVPAYFIEVAPAAVSPSPPAGERATQGEAMEAAPKTGPSPVGAASPCDDGLTPPGWPKPAGPSAVSLQDLREQHCRMPLWGPEARSGLYCGEPSEFARAYCAACRPLAVDKRQTRTVQERAASSAKLVSAGRTGAFA